MAWDSTSPYEDALEHNSNNLSLITSDGDTIALDVARWLRPVDAVDRAVLDRCDGSVLDVGSGPGRFVDEWCARGRVALGVDIARAAVLHTRERGLPALHRSVFDPVPGEGRWDTVLLMDGNIGIGGDPDRLLLRIVQLQAPEGRLIVETDPDPEREDLLLARFTEHGEPVGPVFPWARLGTAALARTATAAGYGVAESWSSGGRCFVVLGRDSTTRRT